MLSRQELLLCLRSHQPAGDPHGTSGGGKLSGDDDDIVALTALMMLVLRCGDRVPLDVASVVLPLCTVLELSTLMLPPIVDASEVVISLAASSSLAVVVLSVDDGSLSELHTLKDNTVAAAMTIMTMQPPNDNKQRVIKRL